MGGPRRVEVGSGVVSPGARAGAWGPARTPGREAKVERGRARPPGPAVAPSPSFSHLSPLNPSPLNAQQSGAGVRGGGRPASGPGPPHPPGAAAGGGGGGPGRPAGGASDDGGLGGRRGRGRGGAGRHPQLQAHPGGDLCDGGGRAGRDGRAAGAVEGKGRRERWREHGVWCGERETKSTLTLRARLLTPPPLSLSTVPLSPPSARPWTSCTAWACPTPCCAPSSAARNWTPG